MKLTDAKLEFISTWGALGTKWGINRSMAEIQGLLLCSTKPMNTSDIMEALDISHGNANQMIRELVSWGLIKRAPVKDRKEYFVAEKNMHLIMASILKERRKRELDPLIKLTRSFNELEGNNKETEAFRQIIADIKSIADLADRAIEAFIRSEENALMQIFRRLLK